MANSRDLLSSFLFWSGLAVASGAAFATGFYYTHGATSNVPVKQQEKPPVLPTPWVSTKPVVTPTPTMAPGLIPVSLPPSAPTETPFVEPTLTPVPVVEITAAPTATPAGPPIYRVQVGAFDSREVAQKQVDDLQTQGINAVVVWDGGSYRAQLGAFSDRARALSVADEVNTRGYAVTIRH